MLDRNAVALNGICPYFTMFPLDFPLRILKRNAQKKDLVLDPFCGRGTTNFAARALGLQSIGVDSSPVATAITASKLAITTIDAILAEARAILECQKDCAIPNGEFWQWAFHPAVLETLCRFRAAFLDDCSVPARVALRGIILGALHGPKQKTFPSYFSNQSPRTYAPKPLYAVRYWKGRDLFPEQMDVLALIGRRAKRYFQQEFKSSGYVRLADSREKNTFELGGSKLKCKWVITSPPYYGMRTYIPDQWLRNWFVGGTEFVDYSTQRQVVHSSPDSFAADLRQVWSNVAHVCSSDATMVIRFGGIADRSANPLEVVKKSMQDSGWRITTIKNAGSANQGKRQADAFLIKKSKPLAEYDLWARKI